VNFDSLDAYPDLKQAVEDCHEAQEDQTAWLTRNHPGVRDPQVAVEILYHLLLRLLWLGEPGFAENAVVRMDEGRRTRMASQAAQVEARGIEGVPAMLAARGSALRWGALPGVLADDISVMLEARLQSADPEARLVRLHNEAAAAAARVEDMLGEDVVLFVLGVAQTRDRSERRKAPEKPAS
jgi:hypothetical protein